MRERGPTLYQEGATERLDLFNDSPVPCLVLEMEGLRVVDVNPAAAGVYGYAREEFVRLKLADLVPFEDLAPAVERLREPGAPWTDLGEWHHRRSDGAPFEVRILARPIRYGQGSARLLMLWDVSAQKEAQIELEAGQRKVASILESIGDPFFALDRDWRFTFLNRHCLPYTKRPTSELLGKVFWDEIPALADSWYAGLYRKVMQDRIPMHFEMPIGDRTYEVDVNPTSEGVAVTFRDVSERKAQEARQRFLLGLSDRIRPLASPNLVMKEAASAVGEFFGVRRALYCEVEADGEAFLVEQDYAQGVASLAGMRPMAALGERVVEELCAGRTVAVENVETEPAVAGSVSAYLADEVRAFVCVPLLKEGRLVSLFMLHHPEPRAWTDDEIALLDDVADRTWHAVEHAQALHQIRALNEELEERVRRRTAELQAAKDDMEGFCYSVSHDLRSPLRAMMASAMILIEDFGPQLNEEGVHQLDRLGRNARRMGDLIDDLLQFSRLGRKEMVRTFVDVSALAHSVVDELEADPAHRGRYRVQPGLEAFGDSQLLRMALENLLGNARKFSAHVAEPVIEFGRDGGAFYVRDNGAGFDMTYAGRLFRPFERLHREEDFPGTGIGLANVRRIVERHGGQIWAEGQPGAGATFWFTLGEEMAASPR